MATRHPSLVPLSREHHDALALAFRLHHPAPPGPVTAVTPASTPASRAAETRMFFAERLVPHFRAEEEALFPALEAPARTLVKQLRAEHVALAELIAVLDPAANDAVLAPRLTAFADLLERHVRTEERELFADFERIVTDPAAARQVGEAIARALAAPACRTH